MKRGRETEKERMREGERDVMREGRTGGEKERGR